LPIPHRTHLLPGRLLFFSIFSILFLLISIIFFITELRPPANSGTPEERSQGLDKFLLFALLALSGAGLPSIWATIEVFGPPPDDALALVACCPLDCIHIYTVLAILWRLFGRRSTEVSSVGSSTGDDQQSS